MDNELKKMVREIITAVIPVIFNLLFNYGMIGIFSLYYMDVPTFILSIFIMYIIFTLLLVLVKKSNITTYILCIIILVISIINGVKIYYTSAPIYLSDIYFLGNLGEIAGIVKSDFINHLDYVQLGILIVLLITICIIAKKNTIVLESKKMRIITGIIDILLIIILLVPINSKDNFILNYIYKVQDRKDYDAIITGANYYARYGVIAGMYGIELENRYREPENYNEEEVKEVLENSSLIETEDDLGKPNIIVMFQESYWDIENIEEVEFDQDITQNFDELKELGTSVKLLSSAYGGMSSNIEFELLTGGNLAYFGVGYNPFLQLYKEVKSENNPSIIKELKNNGYTTKVIFGRDYYRSESVYKRLGIDEYINTYTDMQDYEEKIKGTYISDEALVNEVLDIMENKGEDPIFCMIATIQTHMPFSAGKYEDYDIQVTNTSLSEEETGVILSYAQGVYDTNVQIKRLYDEIQEMEEPTILVVLGDHLPYLYNSDGEDILSRLSYFNTDDEEVNLLRKYTTEALILTNYDADINFESEYISPDMLLTNIINNMDIEISAYYKWLYSIMNILPAQNQYMTIDINSNIYLQDELLDELEATRDLRENIQYYLFK